MSNYDSTPVELLNRLISEDRENLKASDAGTGLTHINSAAVLAEKEAIARRLTHMAFSLSQRGSMSPEDFAMIVGECRPYQTRSTIPVQEAVRVS